MNSERFQINKRTLLVVTGGNPNDGYFKKEIGTTWIKHEASEEELKTQLENLGANEFGTPHIDHNHKMRDFIRMVTKEQFLELVPEMEGNT